MHAQTIRIETSQARTLLIIGGRGAFLVGERCGAVVVERSRDGRTIFEHPTDAHCNTAAHQVVADALAASNLYRTLFADFCARCGQASQSHFASRRLAICSA